MGIFSKKRSGSSGRGELQYPDELAQKAALAYGSADFGTAMEGYANAIDKIHTMCVVASPPRLRTPGLGDQYILDGFVNSVGASLSMEIPLDANLIERTLNYLGQIAGEAGSEAGRYQKAITDVQFELR